MQARARCEVCQNFRPDAKVDPSVRLVEVAFDVRAVVLCAAHARIAERSGATSFEQLREIYGKGRRSFVPRRGPDPAQAGNERRQHAGRRASDAR
jgi:hypothetical protein